MAPDVTQPTATTVVRTFFIADVRGYTRFTAERGDIAAGALATRFAALVRDAVEARGGVVIELRGDEALAVFESPAQAVRAALEFQATCAEESVADPAFPLPVGIGIDTGEAVPVEDGFRGVALNMAARLCSSAAAGQVLVTRTVVEHADSATSEVDFVERGPATFKGFEAAVDVIEATAAQVTAPVPPGAPTLSLPPELDVTTPLVAREHELRWLRGTWRVVRRGRGRVLVVSGPASIGKTRLVAELAAHVHADGNNVRYAGSGGAATAVALAAVREVAAVSSPTMLVLDDVDVLGPQVAHAVDEWLDVVATRPVLVVAVVRDPAATTELTNLIARCDLRGDGHRALGPLDDDGIRDVIALYAGDDVASAPVEAMARASAGVPGRVHEVASEWARTEATRRLSAAAEFLAAARNQHSSDLAFANNVIGLKLGRLYDSDQRDRLTVETCPYKGLAQFEAEDSAYFYGRERLVGELAARTVHVGLLGVVGASGSGKSSVIAAGLVPSLRAGLLPGSERWTHASMRPGDHPVDALRRALDNDTDDPLATTLAAKTADERLVLVVDQFEELFTTCTSDDERARFAQMLADASTTSPDRVIVVLAVRGDYYAHVAAYPDLAALLAANHVLVGPLTRAELRRAVQLPARRAGVGIETALADQLVEEVAEEPGGLPFLSTALVELWHARDGGWVRASALEHTGGVRGAVARLAESSYGHLSDTEQSAARRVFLRLVAAGEGDSAVRRRVPLTEFELDRDSASAGVIARLTQDRLLTVAEDSVEVAHEALLREWPRLRDWLGEDAQGRALRQHVTQSAKQWQANGGEDSELYRGARLSASLDWAAAHGDDLNELERDFLATSRQAGERDAERQRRTNRRLRGLLGIGSVLLVLALVAGVLAAVQRSSAQRSANRAQRAATTALAQSLGSQAVSEQHLDVAMLLAREAVALDPSLQTRSDLLNVLLRAPAAVRTYHLNGNRNSSVDVSPDGRLLAIEDNDGTTAVERVADGSRVGILHVDHIGWGPDGSLLTAPSNSLSGSHTGIELRDPATLRVTRTIPFPAFGRARHASATLLGVADHGRRLDVLLARSHDTNHGPVTDAQELVRYDYATGRILGRVLSVPAAASAVAVPGDRVFESIPQSDSGQPAISKLVDEATGANIRTWPFAVDAAAASPDGTTITYVADGALHFLDLRTGRDDAGVGDASNIGRLAFTPDGSTVISAGEDGQLRLWDVGSHRIVRTLTGHAGPSHGLSISRDGSTVYSGSFDTNVIGWDLSGSHAFAPSFVTAPTNTIFGAWTLSVSPDGKTFAEGTSDGDVVITDVATKKRTALFRAAAGVVVAVSFSPDGHQLLVASDRIDPQTFQTTGRWARIWSLGPHPALRHELDVSNINDLTWAAWSPNGKTVAATGFLHGQDSQHAGMVAAWDAQSGQPIGAPRVINGGYGTDVVFSPDGRTMAVTGANFDVQLYDSATIRPLARLRGSAGTLTLGASFAPDGSKVATAGFDGSIGIYDARTGAPEGKPIVDPAQNVVASVAWSPDGRTIAAADWVQTLRLFDVATRQQLGPPLQLAAPDDQTEPYVVFAPDGSSLIETGDDNRTTILPMTLSAWESRACQVANRNFTREEWAKYLPGRAYQKVCPALPAG